MEAFHFLLSFGDGFADPRMDNGLARRHAHGFQNVADPFGSENTHQVVLHRHIELAEPRVALSSRPSAQLIINAAAFVAFGSQNVQAPCF